MIQAVFSYFNPMVLMEVELKCLPQAHVLGSHVGSGELEGCGTLRR